MSVATGFLAILVWIAGNDLLVSLFCHHSFHKECRFELHDPKCLCTFKKWDIYRERKRGQPKPWFHGRVTI